MSAQASKNETKVTTPTDTTIRIEREFDAPRELVWECFSDADLLAQWIGPRKYEIRVEKFDFREGGEWKYIHSDDENEYVFFGEFRKIDEPEHVTQTFNFVMEPQIPGSIDASDFIDLGGDRCRVVTISTFESQDFRDGMIQSGMEGGLSESYERLDELAARKLAG